MISLCVVLIALVLYRSGAASCQLEMKTDEASTGCGTCPRVDVRLISLFLYFLLQFKFIYFERSDITVEN